MSAATKCYLEGNLISVSRALSLKAKALGEKAAPGSNVLNARVLFVRTRLVAMLEHILSISGVIQPVR